MTDTRQTPDPVATEDGLGTVDASAAPTSDDRAPRESLPRPVPKPLSKTPTFQAMNALRYRRQEMINTIEAGNGRKLICYVAGHEAEISRDDAVFFADLLHNVPTGHPIDLMLQTPGGDVDAAEKLIWMVRNKAGKAALRVIVPDYAKSAGTLIALGADVVLMSDSSELGPIDPQITMVDATGHVVTTPVHAYLEAYREHSDALRRNPEDVVARLMLSKIDPTKVMHFDMVMRRARTIAEDLLRQGMFRTVAGNITKTAGDLLDPSQWPTHGQMISSADALGIGLNVDIRAPDDAEWQSWWQLYCHLRLDITPTGKLFESSYVCLPCVASA